MMAEEEATLRMAQMSEDTGHNRPRAEQFRYTFRVPGLVKRSISWRHCRTATRGQITRVARP